MDSVDRELLRNLRVKLPIDQFALEDECCRQPLIYDEIGEWVASVKAAARTAKEHVAFVEADLFLRIKRNPEDFNIEKLTVDAVKAGVKVNLEYKQAFQEYVEAERLANEAITLLESVAERKSSVRDLVRLYIAHYYEKTDQVDVKDWREAHDAIQAIRDEKAAKEERHAESVEEE